MKLKRNSTSAMLAVYMAFGGMAGAAMAQGSIQMSDESLEAEVVNPFAPPPVARQEKVEPVVIAPKMPTTMDLVPEKTMATQLQEMGQAAGWNLVWDASDFSVGQRVPVSHDFVKALSTAIESANTAGVNLRATFYRGNNTVRVTEF